MGIATLVHLGPPLSKSGLHTKIKGHYGLPLVGATIVVRATPPSDSIFM